MVSLGDKLQCKSFRPSDASVRSAIRCWKTITKRADVTYLLVELGVGTQPYEQKKK